MYLITPAGHPNYGDEFIVRAWLRHLSRTRPGAEVVVDCHTPGQAATLLRWEHPRATFVDTAWRICVRTSDMPPTEALTTAERIVHDPGLMCELVTGIELLARADTVHLLGGGYLNTIWPHHLTLLAIAAAAVDRSGGRVVATGQGLTPGDADHLRLLHEQQARFDLFDVRDAPSRRMLETHRQSLSFTGDDAWLGCGDRDVYDTTSEAAQRRFMFCLQSDLVGDFGNGRGAQALTQMIGELITRWQITGEQVGVVEGIPGVDRVVYDRIAHLIPGAAFVPFSDLWQRGLPARAAQTWISTRFHPHLLAAATGASGIALSGRDDYYPVKHQSLIDAGSRWILARSTDVPSEPVESGGFPLRTVTALRDRKRALAESLYPTTRKPRPLHRVRNAWRTVRYR